MPYTFHTVSVSGAADGTHLGGINNAGTVAGYDAGFGADHYPHAFTYANGAFSQITLANSQPDKTAANDINNAGQVVGSDGGGFTRTFGFIWSPDGSSQEITSIPSGGSVPTELFIDKAYGLNDAGQVVGVDFRQGGFLWQNGAMSFFQVPGTTATAGHDINDGGTIVGTADSKAFIDVGGQFSLLNLGQITEANAINNNGVVAGDYFDGTHWHGFIDSAGQIQTIDATGATDTHIEGINDAGTISGYYTPAAGGVTQGFIATDPPVPSPLSVLDTSSHVPLTASGTPYTGPVAGLQSEYINITSDSLNVTTSTPNWFIHTGSGTDAIAVTAGTNVLDGGTGSNFLTGGNGTDTFFVDDRSASADIWSTVVGFHQGDAATIWGVTPQDFNLAWADGQGAAGYTGLTLHATKPSSPTASLTLAGYSQADLTNGRLSVQFGTDTASGSSYMYVHA